MPLAAGTFQRSATPLEVGLAANPPGASGTNSTAPVRVNTNRAICSPLNLPRPRRLAMVPWGSVAGLLCEKPVPSSVPASQG